MDRQQFQEIRSKSGGRTTRAVRPGRRQTTECRAHCAGAIRARDKTSYLEGDSPTALPAPSALELALPTKRAHSETTVRCVLYMFAYTCMYGHVLCNCQDVYTCISIRFQVMSLFLL